ncbi:hypothetical protein PB2503_00250 [Parvularcula bermudensis HTCC2503]|uniref:Uncharacterized protein n=1 Tax=Parvularcula bermudensis (strain ATCC BAA-594 / HTCC2503 / KCTC 12087) TaxID=314260 RepID=E0TI06_PARBH|nr:hypothetical protein [Parvularcula bermudensis]ADM10817.1 hypothetical protein PB2503_00250 [Parvularcula bermudensis HTCC2503]
MTFRHALNRGKSPWKELIRLILPGKWNASPGERDHHVMTAEDAATFEAALNRNATVMRSAKTAAAVYRARVVHAD